MGLDVPSRLCFNGPIANWNIRTTSEDIRGNRTPKIWLIEFLASKFGSHFPKARHSTGKPLSSTAKHARNSGIDLNYARACRKPSHAF